MGKFAGNSATPRKSPWPGIVRLRRCRGEAELRDLKIEPESVEGDPDEVIYKVVNGSGEEVRAGMRLAELEQFLYSHE